MRRRGVVCRSFGRECEMEVERNLVHKGLDGRVFRVRRVACSRCGKQVVTARNVTLVVPHPPWITEDSSDDIGVEVYEGENPWGGG